MSEPFLPLSREQLAEIARAVGTPDKRVLERTVVALVHVLREEDAGGDARKRARRIGALTGLAGMLGQVPAEALQLIEEARAAVDIAAVEAPQRSDEQIAADLLVLWGLVDDLATAEGIAAGTSERSLLDHLVKTGAEKVREAIPEKWTPIAALKFLWKARELRKVRDVMPGGIVRNIPVVGAVPTALRAGRDMRAFQEALERHYDGLT
jgi:hypothetical protein